MPRLLRLPYAILEGKGMMGNLRDQFAVVVVDHIVQLGPFVNKNPEYIMQYGRTRDDYSTMKLSDGSWLYIALPMEIVAAMIADESQSLTPEEWLERAEDVLRGDDE